MGARGPAKQPLELQERRGNPGKRALPNPTTVIEPLVATSDLVEFQSGADMLQYVLDNGGDTWIGATDIEAQVAVMLWDDWTMARAEWQAAPGDSATFKAYKGLTEELHRCLGKLGLNPADRGALGLARAKTKSKLEELCEKRRAGRRVG